MEAYFKPYKQLFMKKLTVKLACIAMAIAATGCGKALNENILTVPAGDAPVTRSAVLTEQYFPHCVKYAEENGSFVQQGNIPEEATLLEISFAAPEACTLSGASVLSRSKDISGYFSAGGSREADRCVFAQLGRWNELKQGQEVSFSIALPPASYADGELRIRLHTCGNAVWEAGIGAVQAGSNGVYMDRFNKVAGNNWISALPDATYACRLSIPGTHDAATGDGTAFSLGKTQSLSLQEQWDRGIRMFDLRPGYKKVRKSIFKYVNELHIYHGIVETKTSFKEAIKLLSDNLAANPGEFAVIVMRFENDSPLYNKRDVWNALMSEFLASDDFPAVRRVDFRPDLTVGELRGKILVLSRDAYANVPSTGAFVSGWSHSESGTVSARISGKNSSATLCLQDYYSVQDSNAKLNALKSYIDLAATSGGNVWTINHCSGYTGSTGSDSSIKKNAVNTNGFVIDYLLDETRADGPAGIILMDHAGVRKSGSYELNGDILTQVIIDNNFKTALDRKKE